MLRIGVDVDGVIADFRTAFRATAARCLRRDVPEFENAESAGPLSPDEIRKVWDHIGKTQNWWMDVPAYEPDQIARLYSVTRAAAWEVFFLTKRPSSAGDAVQFQTQWWIERFGFYLPAVLTVPGSRGEVANGLRLDMIIDDQLLNCAEVISASTTKALLMLRSADNAAREHASNRGIGVVSTLSEAITVLERLHDVLPQKRGRLMRLSEWFSPADEMQTLPTDPRSVRPIPPYDPRR
ncbi:MAG TPA: hypothetical protein VL225_17020 [Vicinamibacterales bacterium]|jgi:hypothetical protein|nr:hypothetical protein [Vicinamibacterales bacterium]